MTLLVVVCCYLLGSLPTAYIAGYLLKGKDIRQMGDGNMGAQNAFRQLGLHAGVAVGCIDVAKGMLAVVFAQKTGMTLPATMAAGVATVAGHNFPVFIKFRGGRGESTTIGILLMLVTQPMLIVAGPAALVLLIKKNVTLASAFLFIGLPFAGWWAGIPGILIIYGMALPSMVALTHLMRFRESTELQKAADASSPK